MKGARIGILGITFKENVPDLRNSRVPDIVAELREFGIAALVADPLADPAEAQARIRRRAGRRSNISPGSTGWSWPCRTALLGAGGWAGYLLHSCSGRGLCRRQIGGRPRPGSAGHPLLEPLRA